MLDLARAVKASTEPPLRPQSLGLCAGYSCTCVLLWGPEDNPVNALQLRSHLSSLSILYFETQFLIGLELAN